MSVRSIRFFCLTNFIDLTRRNTMLTRTGHVPFHSQVLQNGYGSIRLFEVSSSSDNFTCTDAEDSLVSPHEVFT